ncbi:btb/poz domain-containing protein [Anaeramoeba ignava]|uniref:Btb/poz domain-containing protein n=1 Tax=Anaeramoeba ignava TaxID=1746090 RepID=A0A9Q0RCD9_ANAIG|nr:btb/poz domain-containing protein [Anaeramoeba ignava]
MSSLVFSDDEKLKKNLQNVFLNKKYTDFEIKVINPNNEKDIKIFPTHRAILMERSEYFNGLFRSKMKEEQQGFVEFNDISVQTMETILEYIYTGSLHINHNNALEILVASKKFCFEPKLTTQLVDFIRQNINNSNVIDLLNFANNFGYSDISACCFNYITWNPQPILESHQIREVSEEDLNVLVVNENLKVNEELELFNYIVDWAQFNLKLKPGIENLQEKDTAIVADKIKKLVSNVRFCEIDKEDFSRIAKMKIIPDEIVKMMNEFFEKNLTIPELLIFQPRSKFPESKIIGKNYEYIQLLKEWINDNEFFNKMQLGYGTDYTEYTTEEFHAHCDEKGKTLVIYISSDGDICGGFTKVGWTEDRSKWRPEERGTFKGNIIDPDAFIFTLKNPRNHPPTKFKIRKGKEEFAIWYEMIYGPCFGGIRTRIGDIELYSNVRYYFYFGESYEMPDGVHFGRDDSYTFLMSGSLTRFECFYIPSEK